MQLLGKWIWPLGSYVRNKNNKILKVVKLKELWGHGYRGTTFNFKAAVSILIKMLEVTQLVHRA